MARHPTRLNLLVALALALSLVAAVDLVAPAAAEAITCYTSTDDGDTWYQGDRASYRYDARFDGSRRVGAGLLDSHIPQGLSTWTNWNGGTADLLLMTAYRPNGESRVQGINPATGNKTRQIRILEGHVGGIAVSGKWAFVSHPGGDVRAYELADFRRVLNGSANGDYVTYHHLVTTTSASSFLAARAGVLHAGKFNKDGRGYMERFRIDNSTGRVTKVGRRIEVPKKTQGLAVTKNHFIYSTSWSRYRRSNVYVVERGERDLDAARKSCFRAPSMSQGGTLHDGRFYLSFESGAYKYDDPCGWGEIECTRNVIDHLHVARTSKLTNLVP